MAKLWAILGAIGGVILAIFSAFRAGSKSKTHEIKAQQEEAAREYEKAGSEALIGGLEKERQAKDEEVDTTKRDHFS